MVCGPVYVHFLHKSYETVVLKLLLLPFRGGSRNFREGFPYHSQWSSNFTAIFDGNSRFFTIRDLEKFYGQLIKNFEMEGVSGNPRNPPKTAPAFAKQITYQFLN